MGVIYLKVLDKDDKYFSENDTNNLIEDILSLKYPSYGKFMVEQERRFDYA